MSKLDFRAINAAVLGQWHYLIKEWLPGGKFINDEYFVRNPMRDDRNANSFSVNAHSGQWFDFASGDKGGDPISLYAFLFCGGDNLEAARQLADRFGISPLPAPTNAKPTKQAKWVNAQAPDDPPKPPAAHYYRGQPDAVYTYLSQQGQPLGYVCRFTKSEGGKETIPLTWCQEVDTGQEGWHWKAFAEPRPLYGLDKLAARPEASVLLVEGEKCADAAAVELPDWVCMTWPGGSKAVKKADWLALRGRKVILWPDCDALADKDGKLYPEVKQPGVAAMAAIADQLLALGCNVSWLRIPKPGEKPSGWDVADAIADGLRGADLAAYVRDKAVVYAKKSPPISPPRASESSKKTRENLEVIIDQTDGLEELTGSVRQLVLDANVTLPVRDFILGKLAKKAGVSKWSLLPKKGNGGGDGGDGGELVDRIDELNQRHAIVPMGGRILILNRDYDPVLKKNYFSFSSRPDFELRYCNQKVWLHGEDRGIGQVWIDHPQRRQYEGMAFTPEKQINNFINLWQGWGVKPEGGSCDLFLAFIGEVICAGDDSLFDYVTRWCAHLVQRPRELPETALVLRGKEGAGKNQFMRVLGHMVGAEHYLLLTSMGQVTGRFSGHMANALLVFCNEAVWGGDKSAQGVLKSMITDNVQPVEYKGRDICMVANYKRVVMASNEDWVVPRGANDRHYVIIDVDNGRVGDFAFWERLTAEIRHGCASAFMRYLRAVDLTDWHPRMLPAHLKERGWDLKIRGGGSVVQWWFDVLDDGWLEKTTKEYAGNEDHNWPSYILKEAVHDHYIAWATKRRVSHIESSTVIGKHLAKWGVKACRLRDANSVRQPHYVLPTLDVARKKFTEVFGIPDKVLVNDEENQEVYEGDFEGATINQ